MAAWIPRVQLAMRAGLAAGLAAGGAQLLALPFPIYAMIAAVIVTDLAPAQTRSLAAQRVAGTVLGASLGAALAGLSSGAAMIALGVCVAMLACHALRMGEAARLAGYVCGIVLLDHVGQAWMYAAHRLLETLLGLAIAVLVSLVPKLLRVEERPPPG